MNIFVDDERMPPAPEWQWEVFRDCGKAIAAIVRNQGNIEILSLDHDMGQDVPTGYDIASWLEKEVWTNGMIPPKILRVHSANPVGKQRILQCFESIVRFCFQSIYEKHGSVTLEFRTEIPTIEVL